MTTLQLPKTAKGFRHLVGGKFFTVLFIKKGDNNLRRMTSRMGVKKYLRSNSQQVKSHNPNIVKPWACDVKGYRSFDLSTVITVRANGAIYRGPLYGGAR